MWTRRQFLSFSLTAAGAGAVNAADGEAAPFRFGVIADPQYADVPTKGSRHYRQSLKKLSACIQELNQHELEFTVTLGDLIDRDFASYDPVLERYQALRSEHRVVLGNHDFSVRDEDKGKVLKKLGLERGYRSFRRPGWRTVLLDGTEVSTYRHPRNDARHQQGQQAFAAAKEAKAPGARPWNGALADSQLEWLEKELKAATAAGQRVILGNHFPVMPQGDSHNLWNAEAVVALIRRYPCVALYLNGHNHAGNYAQDQHCHYVNLKGMVETETKSAFAVITCHPNSIAVEGFGTEPDRSALK